MRRDAWKPRHLDPDNADQMDAFNDEYCRACELLGIARDQMLVTVEQAATYLRTSPRTITRYMYAKPAVLDRELVVGILGHKVAMVVLDSAVERVAFKGLARAVPQSTQPSMAID